MRAFFAFLGALLSISATPYIDLSDSGIPNGSPVVIEDSPGGSVDDFIAKAEQLKAAKTQVIVDGPCASACTELVDIDRDHVCLTTKAVFGYHQAYYKTEDGLYHYTRLPLDTPGLDKFLDAAGGPPKDPEGVLVIPFHFMKRFYKPCAGATEG